MGLVGRARHIAYREPVYLLVTNGSLCFRHASLQSANRTVARKGLQAVTRVLHEVTSTSHGSAFIPAGLTCSTFCLFDGHRQLTLNYAYIDWATAFAAANTV